MDPTTPTFWQSLPIPLRFLVANDTLAELTKTHRDTLLAPLSARYLDFAAFVKELDAIVAGLTPALGDADVVRTTYRQKMQGRSVAVVAMERSLGHAASVGRELADRDVPEGRILRDLTRKWHEGLVYREVLDLAPGVIRFLDEHGPAVVGKGFTADEVTEVARCFAVVRDEAGEATDELLGQEALTAELHALLDRLQAWMISYANRREVHFRATGKRLPGFNLQEALGWQTTRGADVRARQADAAEPPAPEEAPGAGVIADAMAAFEATGDLPPT